MSPYPQTQPPHYQYDYHESTYRMHATPNLAQIQGRQQLHSATAFETYHSDPHSEHSLQQNGPVSAMAPTKSGYALQTSPYVDHQQQPDPRLLSMDPTYRPPPASSNAPSHSAYASGTYDNQQPHVGHQGSQRMSSPTSIPALTTPRAPTGNYYTDRRVPQAAEPFEKYGPPQQNDIQGSLSPRTLAEESNNASYGSLPSLSYQRNNEMDASSTTINSSSRIFSGSFSRTSPSLTPSDGRSQYQQQQQQQQHERNQNELFNYYGPPLGPSSLIQDSTNMYHPDPNSRYTGATTIHYQQHPYVPQGAFVVYPHSAHYHHPHSQMMMGQGYAPMNGSHPTPFGRSSGAPHTAPVFHAPRYMPQSTSTDTPTTHKPTTTTTITTTSSRFTKGKVGKRTRATKDKSAPKHPTSAFLYYLSEVRPRYTAKYPGSTVGPISKMISTEWKALSDETRKIYLKKADDDKMRYAREMQVWLAAQTRMGCSQ
ncbi:hypothetical protein HDV05_002116 [Chytridiales sp. JEL 0842]|nr:hypothetical protein HDV05_002116 [Chytridiales sp. JEL 0842]